MTRNLPALLLALATPLVGVAFLASGDLTDARTKAATWQLLPVGGTVRSDVPGVWYVVDSGTHYHTGIGALPCSGGALTVMLTTDGDKDGWGSLTPDGVYASLGITAGLSISHDRWRVSFFQDGVPIGCDAPVLTAPGSNQWLSGVIPVLS